VTEHVELLMRDVYSCQAPSTTPQATTALYANYDEYEVLTMTTCDIKRTCTVEKRRMDCIAYTVVGSIVLYRDPGQDSRLNLRYYANLFSQEKWVVAYRPERCLNTTLEFSND